MKLCLSFAGCEVEIYAGGLRDAAAGCELALKMLRGGWHRVETPKCCEGCYWWKYLSSTAGDGAKACHLFLETGVRNGRRGDRCATRMEKRHRRGNKKV